MVEELAPSHFRAPRNPGSLLEVRFPPAQNATVRKVRPRLAPLRRIPWHVVVGYVLPTTDSDLVLLVLDLARILSIQLYSTDPTELA